MFEGRIGIDGFSHCSPLRVLITRRNELRNYLPDSDHPVYTINRCTCGKTFLFSSLSPFPIFFLPFPLLFFFLGVFLRYAHVISIVLRSARLTMPSGYWQRCDNNTFASSKNQRVSIFSIVGPHVQRDCACVLYSINVEKISVVYDSVKALVQMKIFDEDCSA